MAINTHVSTLHEAYLTPFGIANGFSLESGRLRGPIPPEGALQGAVHSPPRPVRGSPPLAPGAQAVAYRKVKITRTTDTVTGETHTVREVLADQPADGSYPTVPPALPMQGKVTIVNQPPLSLQEHKAGEEEAVRQANARRVQADLGKAHK